MKNKMIRSILHLVVLFVALLPMKTFALAEPKATLEIKPILIRISLQEAHIIRQLMQQIELATQEVAPYLEIIKPLDQLIETSQGEDKDKKVILRLPIEAVSNLLLFMQRANIPALGARQIDEILKKIQKSLPKGLLDTTGTSKKMDQVTLNLTPLEASFIQNMLERIDIGVEEIEPFLAIFLPLEKSNAANLNAENPKDVNLKLPTIAPRNLLLFLERMRISGQQAKLLHVIIEKLKSIIEAQIRAAEEDSAKEKNQQKSTKK